MYTRKIITGLVGFMVSSSIAMAGSMGAIEQPVISPVITLFGGVGFFNVNHSPEVFTGTDDDIFTYYNNRQHSNSGLLGVFVGGEHALPRPGLFMQGGLEYTAFENSRIKGSHSVGIEPATSTYYNYKYTIQTQQLLAVAKLFGTLKERYHPYVSVGLGAAFNDSTAFSVSTTETGSLNIAPIYGNHTKTAFSYSAGLGVDADLNQHVRLGLGYRFAGLGKSSLGNGSVNMNTYSYPTGFSLSAGNAYVNQLVAQISYVV